MSIRKSQIVHVFVTCLVAALFIVALVGVRWHFKRMHEQAVNAASEGIPGKTTGPDMMTAVKNIRTGEVPNGQNPYEVMDVTATDIKRAR